MVVGIFNTAWFCYFQNILPHLLSLPALIAVFIMICCPLSVITICKSSFIYFRCSNDKNQDWIRKSAGTLDDSLYNLLYVWSIASLLFHPFSF